MKKFESESVNHPVLSNSLQPRLLSVHEIFQARTLEWVAILFPGDLLNPGFESRSLILEADSLLSEPPGNPKKVLEIL